MGKGDTNIQIYPQIKESQDNISIKSSNIVFSPLSSVDMNEFEIEFLINTE